MKWPWKTTDSDFRNPAIEGLYYATVDPGVGLNVRSAEAWHLPSILWLAFWLVAYLLDGPPVRSTRFALFAIAVAAVAVGLLSAVSWVSRGFRDQGRSSLNSKAIQTRLKKSEQILHWVQGHLNGKKIPELPTSKRVQLAAACWHIAIDHQMSIVVLVHETLHGSALTLMRPMIEAYVRGLWLLNAATDDDLNKAGMDYFPNDFFGKIVADLEKPTGFAAGALSHMKGETWKRLCSYTHTGYMQIGARLTQGGLGYEYADTEILGALAVADSIALMSTIELAGLIGDEGLRVAALNQMRSL